MDMEITFPGGKKVNANFNGFVIKTDQPIYGGGENSAPAPFDYFLASIGTCAGIYVLSFCQQRAIAADKIKIIQKMIPNASGRGIETIALEIQLPPDFPEQYKDAVIRSADLCAVKRYLLNPPSFDIYTTIVDASKEK